MAGWLDTLALRALRHPWHHVPGVMAFVRWRANQEVAA